jgi:hypothetical protein
MPRKEGNGQRKAHSDELKDCYRVLDHASRTHGGYWLHVSGGEGHDLALFAATDPAIIFEVVKLANRFKPD